MNLKLMAQGQKLMANILIALLALSVFSCNNSTMRGGKDDGMPDFKVERVHYEDSITSTEGAIYYKAEIDMPVAGPDSLLNCIKTWINDEMGGSYTGELNCDTAMLQSYAEFFFENDADENYPGSGTQFSIHKVYETEKYVSFVMQGYTYTGGTHGMPFTKGMTFSKADGSRNDWNMFEETADLKELLYKGIEDQYFDGDSTAFFSAIEIMVKDTADFPLPEADPWLVNDSMQFIYQPYEIAPYASGQPTCRISLADVFLFLTDKTKILIQ